MLATQSVETVMSILDTCKKELKSVHPLGTPVCIRLRKHACQTHLVGAKCCATCLATDLLCREVRGDFAMVCPGQYRFVYESQYTGQTNLTIMCMLPKIIRCERRE